MPTFTVQCNNCQGEHVSHHTHHDLISIVNQCSWCGNDVCPKCDRVGMMHTECQKEEKEHEEKWEKFSDGN